MKKFFIILPILVLLLVACSSNTAKKAEGKWQSNDGVVLTIKGESLKVNESGFTLEGTIKNDEKHKDLAKIKIEGETGYIKVDGDKLYALEKPSDKPSKDNEFKKIKQ